MSPPLTSSMMPMMSAGTYSSSSRGIADYHYDQYDNL
jgi:hypothetical protein